VSGRERREKERRRKRERERERATVRERYKEGGRHHTLGSPTAPQLPPHPGLAHCSAVATPPHYIQAILYII